MSKWIKTCLIAILLLSGCGPKKDDPDDQKVVFPDPIGESVLAPTTISYVTVNPISIINQTVSDTVEFSGYLLQIEGLKDTTVEQKINDAIKTRFESLKVYTELKNLPPFRGIQTKVQKDAKVSLNIYTNVSYNVNNVISIVFDAYITITNPDMSQFYAYVTDGMTFELIHGEQLSLSDFLTDDAPVGDLINMSMVKRLAEFNPTDETEPGFYWRPQLVQTGPFTGIKANQAFYLQENGLILILDYRTPLFEVGFTSVAMTLPFYDFQGFVAITQRFMTTQDLYLSTPDNRQFLELDDPSTQSTIEAIDPNLNGDIRITWPKSLDEAFTSILQTLKSDASASLIDYAQTHEVIYLNANITARAVGPFICIAVNAQASGKDFMYKSQQPCFDRNLHELTVSDYFVSGFDYETRLKQLIQRELDLGYFPSDVSIETLYENLTLIITNNGFTLTSKAYSVSQGQDQYLYSYASFADLGVKNLTIFDD